MQLDNDDLRRQIQKSWDLQKEVEAKCKRHEIDMLQAQSESEDLQQDIKKLKKFEFMFEEEKYSKIELQNEITMLNEKLGE